MATVDDLVATREDMDRRSDGPVAAWGRHAQEVVGQESRPQECAPAGLVGPLDAEEFGVLLARRAERGYEHGRRDGHSDAWRHADRVREREVQRESQRWVEVALELVVNEISPALEMARASEAVGARAARKGAPAATRGKAHLAARDAADALEGLRDRLAGLQQQIVRDGISA